MAIVQEKLENGFVRTYSDAGFYIYGGEPEGLYEDAVDHESLLHEYIESDQKISEPTDEEYIEAAKILLGEEDAQ